MLEEPAMFKPLSYSSEFVIIRQYSWRSIDHAWLQVKSIDQAVQIYYMSMLETQAKFLMLLTPHSSVIWPGTLYF